VYHSRCENGYRDVTTFDPRLLTPPREEEEVYPYRRVWPSIVIESGVLFTVALGLFVMNALFGITLSETANQFAGIALALLPAALWSVFALWRERFVPEPRERLLSVFVISALAANAVGVPVVDQIFQVERWLPLASALNRIVGYMFTVGITQEMLKFLVVRYTVWPECVRTRLDAVAYGSASAIGYATVLNLHFAFDGAPPPDVVAGRVFAYFALHVAASTIVAFGLAELHLSSPSALLLPVMVGLAALLAGIETPVYGGLVNATLSLDGSRAKPLLGLLFSLVLLAGTLSLMAFLFNSAERQSREAVVEV